MSSPVERSSSPRASLLWREGEGRQQAPQPGRDGQEVDAQSRDWKLAAVALYEVHSARRQVIEVRVLDNEEKICIPLLWRCCSDLSCSANTTRASLVAYYKPVREASASRDTGQPGQTAT